MSVFHYQLWWCVKLGFYKFKKFIYRWYRSIQPQRLCELEVYIFEENQTHSCCRKSTCHFYFVCHIVKTFSYVVSLCHHAKCKWLSDLRSWSVFKLTPMNNPIIYSSLPRNRTMKNYSTQRESYDITDIKVRVRMTPWTSFQSISCFTDISCQQIKVISSVEHRKLAFCLVYESKVLRIA